MKKIYCNSVSAYNVDLVLNRISELLIREQDRLNLTQIQMSQRLDIPLQTYKRLTNPKNTSVITLSNLAKIFTNSKISYKDILAAYINKSYNIIYNIIFYAKIELLVINLRIIFHHPHLFLLDFFPAKPIC